MSQDNYQGDKNDHKSLLEKMWWRTSVFVVDPPRAAPGLALNPLPLLRRFTGERALPPLLRWAGLAMRMRIMMSRIGHEDEDDDEQDWSWGWGWGWWGWGWGWFMMITTISLTIDQMQRSANEIMIKKMMVVIISKQYRRATALRRTLYKMPGLINQRHAFLEIIK